MIDYLAKAVKIPQIRNRIIFTLSILALYRFLSFIPVPNISTQTLKLFFESSQVLSVLNIFTGGGLKNLSIIALGVGPYISASIVIQLMTMVLPKLEELSKEGTAGRQKINQYTQLLTLPLAVMQAFAIYALFNKQEFQGISLLGDLKSADLIVLVLIMTSGTFLLMWLGEQISERGIGNGMSVIILAGILAGLPSALTGTAAIVDINQVFSLLLFVGIAIAVISGVVYVNESFRKVEVMYSSKIRGGKSYGGGESFIPIKINQAGVIPIIFAVSLVLIPNAAGPYLEKAPNSVVSGIGFWMTSHFAPSAFLYNVLYFILVFVFTYFYTSVTFNPEKVSDDIRRGGGFITGIRPGKSTVEYLKYIISRLTLAGGVFLGLIAVLPSVVQGLTNVNSLALGGTGLLIVVSVILETVKQIQSQVVTREYESFSTR